MVKKSKPKSSFVKLSSYAKVTAYKFSTLLLILFACILLFIDKINYNNISFLKGKFTDITSYTLELIGTPAKSVSSGMNKASSIINMYDNNERLINENDALRVWREKAKTLQLENDKLRLLLNSVNEDKIEYLTTRVISSSGGSFVKTIIVNAGRKQGVLIGNPVVNRYGMIGRVVEIGEGASRVLLVTDLNSQIPVLTEESGYKAILAGNNSSSLFLKFINTHSVLKIGERLITSGDGGLIPAGLVIGSIDDISAQKIIVKPVLGWDRLSFVRIIKYNNKNLFYPSKEQIQ